MFFKQFQVFLKKATQALVILSSLTYSSAYAHFLEIIPDSDIVESPEHNPLSLSVRFTHPMEQGPVMDMAQPKAFDVVTSDQRVNLLSNLKLVDQFEGARAYSARYQLTQPGDHIFYVEPTPYWEPAEGAMIIHYTKVVVDAFNGEGIWDQLVGAPVEIEPLVRPYGLWTGNLFRGIVKKQGKAVPFAEVEVEWRNDGSIKAPFDSYITQVIKADKNGVFSYAMPKSGWWGFAALITADQPMKNPDGKLVPVEEGGLIWVNVRDMK